MQSSALTLPVGPRSRFAAPSDEVKVKRGDPDAGSRGSSSDHRVVEEVGVVKTAHGAEAVFAVSRGPARVADARRVSCMRWRGRTQRGVAAVQRTDASLEGSRQEYCLFALTPIHPGSRCSEKKRSEQIVDHVSVRLPWVGWEASGALKRQQCLQPSCSASCDICCRNRSI